MEHTRNKGADWNILDKNRNYCSALGVDSIEKESDTSDRIEIDIKPKTRELNVSKEIDMKSTNSLIDADSMLTKNLELMLSD